MMIVLSKKTFAELAREEKQLLLSITPPAPAVPAASGGTA
jgi:hypothetical protein